jgi:hypothetical protein
MGIVTVMGMGCAVRGVNMGVAGLGASGVKGWSAFTGDAREAGESSWGIWDGRLAKAAGRREMEEGVGGVGSASELEGGLIDGTEGAGRPDADSVDSCSCNAYAVGIGAGAGAGCSCRFGGDGNAGGSKLNGRR